MRQRGYRVDRWLAGSAPPRLECDSVSGCRAVSYHAPGGGPGSSAAARWGWIPVPRQHAGIAAVHAVFDPRLSVAIEKDCRAKDVSTSERIEVLEVAIPGDDVVRIACDPTFQHHIIVRVVLHDRYINRRFYHMKRCENDSWNDCFSASVKPNRG